MFNKRREKKAQELKEQRRRAEQQFSDALKQAEQIEDPAEKVVALQGLSDEINARIAGETRSINKQANSSENKTRFGSSLAVCASGVTAALIFTTPLGAGIVLGAAGLGYLGSAVAGGARGEAVRDKLMLEATEFVTSLGSIMMAANDLRDATIESDVEAISASPLREKILATEGLAMKFANAAAKNIVKSREAAPEEAPALPPVAEKKGKYVPSKPLPPVLKQKR